MTYQTTPSSSRKLQTGSQRFAFQYAVSCKIQPQCVVYLLITDRSELLATLQTEARVSEQVDDSRKSVRTLLVIARMSIPGANVIVSSKFQASTGMYRDKHGDREVGESGFR